MRNSTVPVRLSDASPLQLLAGAAGLIVLPFIIAINKINGPIMPARKVGQ